MEELGLIEKLFSNVVILISVIGFIKNAISLYFLKEPENIESDFDVTNYNNDLEKLQYNGVMYVILIGVFYCYLNGICPVGRRGYMFY
jgi:hypothetical protein